MIETRPNGVLPVLATPFTRDGELDLDGFHAVWSHVLDAGVHGALLFGLASEFYKLSDAERAALRHRFLSVAADRQHVVATISVTAHATSLAVEEARNAVADGATAINVLPPHFLGPPTPRVLAHLEAVLQAVEVPVVVQYAPAQTGTALNAEMLQALARDHPNLAAVKVETQPPGPLVTQLARAPHPIDAIVGYAGLHLPDAVRRGAVGVQPGCSFVEVYVALWARLEAGSTEAFEDLHRRMLPYLSVWMGSVELIIQVEKTILYRRGLIASDKCREPGWALDGHESAMIDRFLNEFSEELLL